jgi:hypothetical protein
VYRMDDQLGGFYYHNMAFGLMNSFNISNF